MSDPRTLLVLAALGAALGALALPAGAAIPASALPPQLAGIEYRQRPDAALPLDLALSDHRGQPLTLGQALAGRPAVLALVDYDCAVLCSLVLDDLGRALAGLPPDLGPHAVVVLGIDPGDRVAAAHRARDAFLARPGVALPGRAVHFLSGDAAGVKRLADTIGFGFRREPDGRFAHPAGVVVATPAGRVSRYLLGLAYPARALRLALVDAGQGTVGGLADHLLLVCFAYDPARGTYGLAVLRLLQAAGVLSAGALALAIARWLRQERRAASSWAGAR